VVPGDMRVEGEGVSDLHQYFLADAARMEKKMGQILRAQARVREHMATKPFSVLRRNCEYCGTVCSPAEACPNCGAPDRTPQTPAIIKWTTAH
jgi:hypothetical protein